MRDGGKGGFRESAAAGRVALAQGGVSAMAEAMVAVEAAHYRRGEVVAVDVARHYAISNRPDEAMSWLRAAFNHHEARLTSILLDPAFTPIRAIRACATCSPTLALPAR